LPAGSDVKPRQMFVGKLEKSVLEKGIKKEGGKNDSF
jgi:hypothetical protein